MENPMQDEALQDREAFWEDFYRNHRTGTAGRPSALLVRYAADLSPGTGLDLGASHGDDALWLAARGWQAEGIDISRTAVDRATARAQELGLAGRAHFEARDLADGFPDGHYDLVTALYFQSPVDLPRPAILREAADHVAPGGHILVVAHAAAPPWAGERAKGATFPTVASELQDLACDPAAWTTAVARIDEREGTGPDGEKAMLQDTVVMLQRKSPRS